LIKQYLKEENEKATSRLVLWEMGIIKKCRIDLSNIARRKMKRQRQGLCSGKWA